MKRLTLTLTFALAACSGSDTSDVRLDLAALHQHAAQTNQPFDFVELLVTGPGLTMAPVVLDPEVLTFDIEVPSGPARTFAVEAWNDGVDERLTVYWGAVAQDLVPGTTVDLILPVGPAGRLSGTVELIDGTELPAGVELTFTAMEPMPPLPETIVVPVIDDAFSAPMPMGMWNVAASVTVGGTTYSLPEGEHVFVMQGEPSSYDFVLSPPVVVTDATVNVADAAGAPLGDIIVVLHDSTGAVKQELLTDNGTAGLLGQVVVPVDNGDMITVVDDTDPMAYEVYLYTVAGVTRGDVLNFVVGYEDQTPLGSMLIDVTSQPTAATSFPISAGGSCNAFVFVGGGPSSMSVFDSCENSSGQLDILSVAQDGNGSVFGFSTSLGVNPLATSHSLSVWDETPPPFDVTVSNFPAVPPTAYNVGVTFRRGGRDYSTPGVYGNVMTSDPVPVNLFLPRNFADYVDLSVSASSMTSPAEQRYVRRIAGGAVPASVDVDATASMLPEITSVVPDTLTNPSRPTLAWTSTATPASHDAVLVGLNWFESTPITWNVLVPPSAVTTVEWPALPVSLSMYDPGTFQTPPGTQVELVDVSTAVGYSEFIANVGVGVLNQSSSAGGPAGEYTLSISTYYSGK